MWQLRFIFYATHVGCELHHLKVTSLSIAVKPAIFGGYINSDAWFKYLNEMYLVYGGWGAVPGIYSMDGVRYSCKSKLGGFLEISLGHSLCEISRISPSLIAWSVEKDTKRLGRKIPLSFNNCSSLSGKTTPIGQISFCHWIPCKPKPVWKLVESPPVLKDHF